MPEKRIDEQNICPACKSTNLKYDSQRAELSCGRCGYVIDDNIIDQGPEWVAYDKEQVNARSRVGAPMCYAVSDKGLSTIIGSQNKDYNGHNIPENNVHQMYRIRKLHKRSRISGTGERNLALALTELSRLSSNLGIPRHIREDAAKIYRDAASENLVRGRSIEGVVAASVYTACRRAGVPRTLDEISKVSNITKKKIGQTYRFLARSLKIKLQPTSPADYVPRFATQLGLSGEVQAEAIGIINEAKEKGFITGREPTSMAAATLYIAAIMCDEKRTQRDVAEFVGVSEVTIRNRYKELTNQLDLPIPA